MHISKSDIFTCEKYRKWYFTSEKYQKWYFTSEKYQLLDDFRFFHKFPL